MNAVLALSVDRFRSSRQQKSPAADARRAFDVAMLKIALTTPGGKRWLEARIVRGPRLAWRIESVEHHR